MADTPAHPEKVRGTVSLTHKQAALTLVGLLSFSQFNDIKEALTGDTQKNLIRVEQQNQEGFKDLKQEIRAMKDELVTIQRRVRDQTWEEIARVENRCEKRHGEVIARIGNLEVYAYKTKGKGS